MKKSILVISQYFYPEQFRINDICTEWVKRGYEVNVVTGIPNYPAGKFYEGYGLFKKKHEVYSGVNIFRIPIVPRMKNSVMLVFNYLSFVFSGFFWSLFTRVKADVVFIYEMSPMTQALPGIWYAKRKKIPCYIYITDLWPESVEFATNISNKFVLNRIGDMVDWIYKKCNVIFTSSESFITAIMNRGVPENKLRFWPQYAEEFYKPVDVNSINITEIPQDNVFNIIFAGNMGVSQGLDILPEVAKVLKDKNIAVRFNLVGDGRFKRQLISLIEKSNVSDMFNFVQKQPPERIPEYMSVCDAALICLKKCEIFSFTLPAKTQSCLACGIPIIVCADGEIQDVVSKAGAGLCCNAEDVNGLVAVIEEAVEKTESELAEYAKNGVEYSKRYFNKKKLLDEMDNYFT